MFLRRLSIFDYENNEYYKSNGKYNTLSVDSDVNMPNCTRYALSRAYECCEGLVKGVAIKGSYGWHDAKNWYDETGMEKGNILKEGSIAVWDGNHGHTNFIEKKIDDTHAIITESIYNSDKSLRDCRFFNRRAIELKVGERTISGVGALKGFIYLPISDIRTKRNTNKEQVEITEEYVNCRLSAGGELVNKGCYIPVGIYDVQSSKKVDGYVWYQLERNRWVRSGEWLIYYPIENDGLKMKAEEIKSLAEKIVEISTEII